MTNRIDEATSEKIRDKLAPIIAEHGIFPVLLAMADRLACDSNALLNRGPMAERISMELYCIECDIRRSVEMYGGR